MHHPSLSNQQSPEKLLLNRLTEQESMLHPLQGGFRQGLSCIHTAFVLQEAISASLEQKSKVFAAFLDVRKAFDTVWHRGLMVKLAEAIIHVERA